MVLFLVLGALAIGLAATVVGAVVAVRKGIEFFRTVGAFGEALGKTLADLEQSVARTEASAGRVGDTAELQRSLARLNASRTRLHVLTAAWSDVRASVTGFVPRK
jgi:hypothetical protein